MLNSILAAQAIINAWDNWTDESAEAEKACDNVLQAAISYAKALLDNVPHQIPEAARQSFVDAVAVMLHDPAGAMPAYLPNLTFDEALVPLRQFVLDQTTPQPLHKILGPTENVGSIAAE